MANKKTVTLQLKRSATKNIETLKDESVSLQAGEPLFVEAENCIVMGTAATAGQTITGNKVIKAIDKDVADGLGVKWLSAYGLNVQNFIDAGKAYTLDESGHRTTTTTTKVPLAIVIDSSTSGSATAALADIRDGMMPQLSLNVPDAVRANAKQFKSLIADYATISDGEVEDGQIVLYFTNSIPKASFTINLIGG